MKKSKTPTLVGEGNTPLAPVPRLVPRPLLWVAPEFGILIGLADPMVIFLDLLLGYYESSTIILRTTTRSGSGKLHIVLKWSHWSLRRVHMSFVQWL